MKIEKFYEKVQRTKPKLSQFIYQKYLSDLIQNADFLDEKPDRYKNRYEYTCLIEFSNRVYLYDKEQLSHLVSILERLKEFEELGKKRVSFFINQSYIRLHIKLKPAKVKEIEATQEYQDWYKNIESDWINYKEEQELKKATKKYNL